jgi:hypothetical protein
MATVSLDAAMAGGAAIVAVNRMAQSAADRRKDNLIGLKRAFATLADFSRERKTMR